MTGFWTAWVFILTSACLGLVLYVLLANRKTEKRDGEETPTTGHVYDGIEEYDNPLPKWWFQLFIGTFIFGIIYLILYPGILPGVWDGALRVGGEPWTAVNELKHHQNQAQEEYKDSFDKFSVMPVEELAKNEEAMKMGSRLFANNCAVCHGADGGGNYGFPNLTDNDWLYGGSPEQIKYTLVYGRMGNMPAWAATLGQEGTAEVVEYALSLSGLEHEAPLAAKGKEHFMAVCSTCHGQEGKGNLALGAPNLTDDIWLYEGTREAIMYAVTKGRVNRMPAQKDLLREDKIHLLTAYVYSMSKD